MSENYRYERMVLHAGTYRRELPVSIERLYENAIDWEHLPYLHRNSFAKIECINAGVWGFHARVWPQPYNERRSIVIELRLDQQLRRWITSTLDGPGTGTEVWTHAFSLAERQTLVVVDFFMPGVDEARRIEIGYFYNHLYDRLYDEDVMMMAERQVQLDSLRACKADNTPSMVLGSLAEVRRRLPITIDSGGQKFCIVESRGELVAYSTVCPHLLGPLGESKVSDGIIECPWHGYRYDIHTRKCASGANCGLAIAPRVRISADSCVVLEFR
ncbi:MAG: Rieske (2Fe-2S) protein [Deltaproteobacteria bacterium]|nr:Rieske (2Fe-2S) protein [Deltaproteobacteria bacterium]